MKWALLILFTFTGIPNLTAQAPSIQWEKCFGGHAYDYGTSIQQTTDGGFIVTGSSNSTNGDVSGNHGNYDVWVVKLSATASIQWQRSFGGSGSDESSCIRQTLDGGYIIAGGSRSADGDATANRGGYDFWIIKLSDLGSIQWQRSLGGSMDDNAYSIQQTTDSGYIIAGRSYSTDGDITGHHGTVGNADFWIVKLSQGGSLQWQKSLGGSQHDNAMSVQQTSDNGYIVAGDTYSTDGDVTGNHGGEDFWVVRLSSSGTLQWQKALGGTGSDYAQSVLQEEDGGYIIAGGSNSADGDITNNLGSGDLWIVKLSSAGGFLWQKSFGSSHNDAANSIRQTSDGGYIVSGWVTFNDADVTGFHGSSDYWIIKITASGTLTWQKSVGSLGDDVAYDVLQTSDSGYIVAGYTFYSGGDVSFNHGQNDYWIVKLNTPVEVGELQMPETKIAPDPTSGLVNIIPGWGGKILIYNMAGQIILESENVSMIQLDTLPGIYIIALLDNNNNIAFRRQIIKQ